MEKTIITQSEEATSRVGENLIYDLETNLILLEGDLGSGKTALVRGLGSALGIKRISSPTYTIIRSYHLDKPMATDKFNFTDFHHVDLYRIANWTEVETLGLEEIIADNHNLVAVEWPELLKDKINQPATWIKVKLIGESKREITISQ